MKHVFVRMASLEPEYAAVQSLPFASDRLPWAYVLYGDEGSGCDEAAMH